MCVCDVKVVAKKIWQVFDVCLKGLDVRMNMPCVVSSVMIVVRLRIEPQVWVDPLAEHAKKDGYQE